MFARPLIIPPPPPIGAEGAAIGAGGGGALAAGGGADLAAGAGDLDDDELDLLGDLDCK